MKFKIIVLMNLLALVFVSSSYINYKGLRDKKYVLINHNADLKHSIDNQIEVTSCNKCHDCSTQNTAVLDTISTSLMDLTKKIKPQLEESKSTTTNKIENVGLDLNLYPETFKNNIIH